MNNIIISNISILFILGLLNQTKYCNRLSLLQDLTSSFETDVLNYCRIWKTINNYTIDHDEIEDKITEITKIIKSLKDLIANKESYVGSLSSDDKNYCKPLKENYCEPPKENDFCKHPKENGYCKPSRDNEIKSAPCEAASDVFFLIDIQGNFDEQITFVTEVVRNLDLRRNGGAVTVLANTQSNGSILDFVDENNITTFVPLTPLAYNITGCFL